ncbi:hypothetical protein BC829DRAFT_406357 [Chytridium lagenaria]|nr:hypothetical protein BC829DRAFT_406357 [Chytridium lagenaria]
MSSQKRRSSTAINPPLKTGREFPPSAYDSGLLFGSRLTTRLASPTCSGTYGRFTLPPNPTPSRLPSPTPTTHIQQLRYTTFSNAWPTKPNPSLPVDDPYHWVCSMYKSIEELPEIYGTIAVTAENILDDEGWRAKIKFIWSKLPITLIIYSLRLVNPIPFVERLLKLFVWRPPGMSSLLMRLAAIICGLSHTQTSLKHLRPRIPTDTRLLIENAITKLWSSHNDVTLPSTAPRSAFASFLQTHNVKGFDATKNPDLEIEDDEEEREILFARLLVRGHEKEAFAVPGVLQEMWDCTDMARLASTFFDVVTKWLDILKCYDTNGVGNAATELEYVEVVEKMDAAVWMLFQAGYPLVHQLAQKKPVGPEGLHAIIDFIAREVGVTLLNDVGVERVEREQAEGLAKTMTEEERRESVKKARWSFVGNGSALLDSKTVGGKQRWDQTKSVLNLGCPSDRLLAAYEGANVTPLQLWEDTSALISTFDTSTTPSPHLLTTGVAAFRDIVISDFFGPSTVFRGEGDRIGLDDMHHSESLLPRMSLEGGRKGKGVGSATIADEGMQGVAGKSGGKTGVMFGLRKREVGRGGSGG